MIETYFSKCSRTSLKEADAEMKMARLQLFSSTNIVFAKKVLTVLFIFMLIVLYLMDGISIKINVSNVHTFLKSYIQPRPSKNNSFNAVGPENVVDLNRMQNKNDYPGINAANDIVNRNPEIKNHTVANKQHQNSFQREIIDISNDAEVKTESPFQNETTGPLSAEEYYKDPRNVLPCELDPVIASNVSWVSFLSSSGRESVYEEYAKMGIESTELHSFKSPYVVDPRIYRTPETANATSNKGIGSSQFKKKIISCYACKTWVKGNSNILFNRDFQKCPGCEFDLEGKMVPEAEAVIFFPAILGERPVPERPVGQIWIMAEWESPVHFNYPKFYEKWKSVFNWTFTYRVDSDIFAPYYQLAWRNRDLLLKDEEYVSIAKQKTKTAAWFVSNCETQSRRKEYVQKLQEYIDVDIYGKCGSKTCGYKMHQDCEKVLTTTYKFYLSFENSFCKDYVTEKLFRSHNLRTHVIPVTRGGFEYHKYIPPGGYVDAADFKSPKELGLFLKELGNDVNRYAEMLKEKDRLVGLGYKVDWCNICEKLHTRSQFENKIIPDIKHWSHHGACYGPPGWKEWF